MLISLFDSKGAKTEIEIESTDNVVAMKRKLSAIIYVEANRLELFDQDRKLNDNDYIPNQPGSLRYGQIGESNDIIIKVGKNYYNIPAWLQISKYALVDDLSRLLSQISKLNEAFAIISADYKVLQDGYTIEQSQLLNDSMIQICLEKDIHLTLKVTNLIPSVPSFDIQCHICDEISLVKSKIREKFNINENTDLCLFSTTKVLERNSRLVDNLVRNGDLVLYIDLTNKGEIKVGQLFKTGKIAKLHRGKNTRTGSDVVLKKYSLKGSKIDNFKPLTYEITTLLKLRVEQHPRFVKLDSMFEMDKDFYVGLEFISGGSLQDCLPLRKEKIFRYSPQILEALIYLHENKIIYRNMKCSSVLIDGNDNVKLCNFNLSKYLQDCTMKQLLEGELGSTSRNVNWAAPEMLLGKKYGTPADIYSFGATLVEMVTGKPLYTGLKEIAVINKIRSMTRGEKVEYQRPDDLPTELTDIIDLCLKIDPAERETAEQLKQRFDEINI